MVISPLPTRVNKRKRRSDTKKLPADRAMFARRKSSAPHQSPADEGGLDGDPQRWSGTVEITGRDATGPAPSRSRA